MFTIVCSDISPTTVIIPSPEFGEAELIQTQMIEHRTLQGELQVSQYDAYWPEIHICTWQFRGLIGDQKDDLEAHLIASKGLEQVITDHMSATWTGIFLNPEFEFVEHRENDDWGITLRFQGAKS